MPFSSFVNADNRQYDRSDEDASVGDEKLWENQKTKYPYAKNSLTSSGAQPRTPDWSSHLNSGIVGSGKCDSHHQTQNCTYPSCHFITKTGAWTNIDPPCMANSSNTREVQNADVVAIVNCNQCFSHSQGMSQNVAHNTASDVNGNVRIPAVKNLVRNVGDVEGKDFIEKNVAFQRDKNLISKLDSKLPRLENLPLPVAPPTMSGQQNTLCIDKYGVNSSTHGYAPVLTDSATQNCFSNRQFSHSLVPSRSLVAKCDQNDTVTVSDMHSNNSEIKTHSSQYDVNSWDTSDVFKQQNNKCVAFSGQNNSLMTPGMGVAKNKANKSMQSVLVEKNILYPPDAPDHDTQSTKALIDEDTSNTPQGFQCSAFTHVQTHGLTFPLRKNSKEVPHGYFVVPLFHKPEKFTRRQFAQLVSVMVLGFCIVLGILLWLLSPILLRL